jgi:hypothetical protein
MTKSRLNKKHLILSILVLSLLVSVSSVSAIGDVAYIYKNINNVDDNILGVFGNLDLEVDLIDEQTLPRDFSNYYLIYVGDERYRNEELIPVGKYPTVVSNYYFGYEWGLTDFDGISKLASNSPLNVLIDNEIIQVYTQAQYSLGGISIPYYYLDDGNKLPFMQSVARTYIGDAADFGDVISYANAGVELFNGKETDKRICFFGIIESDYWTSEVQDMFEECVAFVETTCSRDSDCPGDKEGEPYCKYGNEVWKDVREYSCKNPGKSYSRCESDLVSKRVEICQDSCSNGRCVNIECYTDEDCDDQDLSTVDKCQNPGTISSYCENTPSECIRNSDCGSPGFIGNSFCSEGDIWKMYSNPFCEFPGTLLSNCQLNYVPRLIEDCDDGNPYTLDSCIENGEAYCQHSCLECTNDNDCLDDYYTAWEYSCSNGNVYKEREFHNFSCISNSCDENINYENDIEECAYDCLDGVCLEPECSNGEEESCSTGLLGICSEGTRTCSNGIWGRCIQNIQPSEEICGNDLDDDCDGFVDEGCNLNCGNKILDLGEDCDDGNNENGDGCDSYCEFETIPLCEQDKGYLGEYFNLPSDHPDTESLIWGDIHGDPLSDISPWTADWYNQEYYRFTRVDENLTFGQFWPFAIAREELHPIFNEDFYYGTHWRGIVNDTGNFQYTMWSDDDSWFYIDGNLEDSAPGIHSKTTRTGTVELNGEHVIDIFFAERYAGGSRFYFDLEGVEIKPYVEECRNETIFICEDGETRPCGGTDIGECSSGTQTCSDNSWGSCVGAVYPGIEICDGLDNDCDGEIDETFIRLGSSCSVGIGACERTGERVCAFNGIQTECNAIPGIPGIEDCNNGIDDDCDGAIDGKDPDCNLNCGNDIVCQDGATRVCGSSEEGVCSLGTQTCSDNSWGNCVGAVYPGIEICDGLDNDCDGYIDEGNVCGGGCNNNTVICEDGETQSCSTGLLGVCSEGTRTCSNNEWGSCVQNTQASIEICDGLDNDCDGLIDEGDVCGNNTDPNTNDSNSDTSEDNSFGGCENPDNRIVIDIDEPDKGDDFEIGDIIEGEVEIKNNFIEKKYFEIEFILYDADDDNKIERIKEEESIKAGKSEDFDFEIEVPDDFEDNDHYILVVVEDEDNSSICNEAYVKIDLEREDHKVVIDKAKLIPEIVKEGDSVQVDISIENIGKSDEDVYLEIEVPELNLLVKSEEFEIEEFGDDDYEERTLYLDIPEVEENEEYEIIIKVVYDDGEDSVTRSLQVLDEGFGSSQGDLIILGSDEENTGSIPLLLGSELEVGEEVFEDDRAVINVEFNKKEPVKKVEYNFLDDLSRILKLCSETDYAAGNCISYEIIAILLLIGAIILTLVIILVLLRR